MDKKIDAEKGSLVDRLPPVLMLHLKRFDFDYQTMRRVKVNDSCEIPDEAFRVNEACVSVTTDIGVMLFFINVFLRS